MDLLTRTIIVILFTLIITGLGAYGYSQKRQQFEGFTFTTLYTIAIISLFCVIYLRDIIQDFSAGKFDLNNIRKLYYYMNIIAGIVCYLTHAWYIQHEITFLNEGKQRLYKLLDYLDDGEAYRKPVYLVATKAVLFPLMLQATLMVRAIHFEPDKSLFWTIYAFVPYVIRTTPATSVYGVMLLSSELIKAVNDRVQKIVDEVNRMHTHKEWLLKTAYHRMQRYCDLSDEIDLLNELYTGIINSTDDFLVFSSLPWLSSILCNVLGIMLGLLTQYMSIADTLFKGKEYDYYNVFTDSAFMFISFLEIYTQSGSCSIKVERVRQTGVILQRADSIDADIRFRESMDFFSLRILQRNYKIKPLGLFEVDLSLIHGVFSTVTGFLLILIQTDLSRRFLQ